MFKKFFKWIKESITNIHKKIYEKKVEEFRDRLGVTYVDKEMHNNPDLERYYKNIYPMKKRESFIRNKINNYYETSYKKYKNNDSTVISTLYTALHIDLLWGIITPIVFEYLIAYIIEVPDIIVNIVGFMTGFLVILIYNSK